MSDSSTSAPSPPSLPVLVIGAGLAGLRCAAELHRRGRRVLVLERGDGVGGRVRTDRVDGFLLDRGFQVLLTAYSELESAFDLAALDLRPFRPGALVWRDGRFERLTDPFRDPAAALGALLRGPGGLGDKLRVARLRRDCLRGSADDLFGRPESTTLEALRGRGFSPAMVDGFFRPFLGGILLDRGLGASSRMFEFVFRSLSVGDAAVPAAGMGALAEQLAGGLPKGSIRLGAEVRAARRDGVELSGGERLEAAAVVLAAEAPAARRLSSELADPGSQSVGCLWFDADRSPVGEPLLVLGGDNGGAINNLAVMSDVAPDYAPAGRHLVGASVLAPALSADDGELEQRVRDELRQWYGGAVDAWRLLRVDRIAHAQPAQPPGRIGTLDRPARLESGLFVAGDHRVHASIEGALRSGRCAAEAVDAALAAESAA